MQKYAAARWPCGRPPRTSLWLPLTEWYSSSRRAVACHCLWFVKLRPHFPSAPLSLTDEEEKHSSRFSLQIWSGLRFSLTHCVSDVLSMLEQKLRHLGQFKCVDEDVFCGGRMCVWDSDCLCLAGSQPAADLNSILTASRQLTAPQCPIYTTDSTESRAGE